MKIRKTLGGGVAVAAIATALTFAAAGAASAATTGPTELAAQVIAPGGTGDVGAVVSNQLGTDQTGVVTLILKAPPSSKFTSTTVWAQYTRAGVQDAGSQQLWNDCELSADAMQLKCTAKNLTVPAAGNGQQGRVKLTSPIKVDDDAPKGVYNRSQNGFQLTNSSDGQITGGNAQTHFTTAVDPDPAASTRTSPLPSPIIAPGGTGDVGAIVGNRYGVDVTGVVTVIIKAPPSSKFTSTTVWAQYTREGVPDAGSQKLWENCELSPDAMQLKCTGSLTVPAAGNGVESSVKLTSPIKVDDNAPPSVYNYSQNGFQLTNSADDDIAGGTVVTHFNTPAVADTPIVDPAVAGGTGILALVASGVWMMVKRRTHAHV